MRQCVVSLASALALVVVAACASGPGGSSSGADDDPLFVPDREFDLQGTITKVEPASGSVLVRILVEEQPGDRSGSMKDFVAITAGTQVFLEQGDRMRRASIDDLRRGRIVAAWYDGAVRESYPRQATAVAIVIAE